MTSLLAWLQALLVVLLFSFEAEGTSTGGTKAWGVATRACALQIPHSLQSHGQFGCPVPIDDHVDPQPASWSPWTHRPACVNTSDGTMAKFCIFTNSRHGIGGVSIVATPRDRCREREPPKRADSISNKKGRRCPRKQL